MSPCCWVRSTTRRTGDREEGCGDDGREAWVEAAQESADMSYVRRFRISGLGPVWWWELARTRDG